VITYTSNSVAGGTVVVPAGGAILDAIAAHLSNDTHSPIQTCWDNLEHAWIALTAPHHQIVSREFSRQAGVLEVRRTLEMYLSALECRALHGLISGHLTPERYGYTAADTCHKLRYLREPGRVELYAALDRVRVGCAPLFVQDEGATSRTWAYALVEKHLHYRLDMIHHAYEIVTTLEAGSDPCQQRGALAVMNALLNEIGVADDSELVELAQVAVTVAAI